MHLRTKRFAADTPTSMTLASVPSDIKEIVDKAVNAALEKFSDKITDIVNSRLAAFESRLVVIVRDKQQQNLAHRESPVADIAAHSESVTRKLQEANSAFEDRLIKVQHSNEVHVNDLEQYIRRNNVRIHGLTIHDEDDCPTAVIHLLNSQLKMNNLTVADL